MKQIELKIGGMSCQHCVHHVMEALQGVTGVQTATVDLARQQASLTIDESVFALDLAAAAIDEAGYELIGQL